MKYLIILLLLAGCAPKSSGSKDKTPEYTPIMDDNTPLNEYILTINTPSGGCMTTYTLRLNGEYLTGMNRGETVSYSITEGDYELRGDKTIYCSGVSSVYQPHTVGEDINLNGDRTVNL